MAGTFDHLVNTAPTKGTFDHLVKGPISVASKARIISPEESLALGDITQAEYEDTVRNIANQPKRVVNQTPPTVTPSQVSSVTVEHPATPYESPKQPLTRDAMADFLNMGPVGVVKNMVNGSESYSDANKDVEWNPYTMTKRVLSGAVASPVSALGGAAGAAWSAPSGSKIDAALEQFKNDYKESYNKGVNNEGVEGVISDPTNLSILIPGLGEAAALGKIGNSALRFLVKNVAAPAIENAAITAATEAIDPEDELNASTIGKSAGWGAAGGLGGRALQAGAIKFFPGRQNNINALRKTGSNIETATRTVDDEIIEPMLREVKGPGTRGQFAKVGEAYHEKSMKTYDDLMNDIDPEKIDHRDINAKYDRDASAWDIRLKNANLANADRKTIDDIFRDSPTKLSVEDNLVSNYKMTRSLRNSLLKANKENGLGLTHKEIDKEVSDLVNRMIEGKYTPDELKNLKANAPRQEAEAAEQAEAMYKANSDKGKIDKEIEATEKEMAEYMDYLNSGLKEDDDLTKHMGDYLKGKKDISEDEIDMAIDGLNDLDEKLPEFADKLQDLLAKSTQLKNKKSSIDERLEAELESISERHPQYEYEVPKSHAPDRNGIIRTVDPNLQYNMPILSPSDLQKAKKWINGDIYNNRGSEGAAQKRAVAHQAIELINELIADMNSLTGKNIKSTIEDANRDYRKYKQINKLLEEYGANSGSSWRFGTDGFAKYTKSGPNYVLNSRAYNLGTRLPKTGALITSQTTEKKKPTQK